MDDAIRLRPLRADDAAAMSAVLADPGLYAFTGGEPPSVEALSRRYAAQLRGGPAGGSETWINLIVELAPGREPIGYVQATVPDDGGPAEIAWVIGAPWQRRGLATAAARLLLDELRAQGVHEIIAHIHPDHAASHRVAERIGMAPTELVVDGETRWIGMARSHGTLA